jgi:hypothetical protein
LINSSISFNVLSGASTIGEAPAPCIVATLAREPHFNNFALSPGRMAARLPKISSDRDFV